MRHLVLALIAGAAQAALNFESVQLEAEDTKAFPAIDFARGEGRLPKTQCKGWPGSRDWPSDFEWRLFNASIDGSLLRPSPPAAACYRGPEYSTAQCSYLLNNATQNDFYIDDPLTVLTQWPQGGTCLPALNATGNCTHGGFPVYVVNATTVKHVQAAVNFARNKNLRLIIKCVSIRAKIAQSPSLTRPGIPDMISEAVPSAPDPSAFGPTTCRSFNCFATSERGATRGLRPISGPGLSNGSFSTTCS